MNNKLRAIVWIGLVLVLASWAVAQTTAGRTAKDPVCGMSVKVEGAKYTAAYEGQTYYFCSQGCKTSFLKDPAKYVSPAPAMAKAAAAEGCEAECAAECPAAPAPAVASAPTAAMPQGCPMMKKDGGCCCGGGGMGPMRMMHGMGGGMGMMGHGMAGMMEDGDIKVENTADGVIVKFTSKDPDVVKLIQAHWAIRMKARAARTRMEPKTPEVKK